MDARRIWIASRARRGGAFRGVPARRAALLRIRVRASAAGIWLWAAFLIVAGTCLLLIGLAGLIAYGRIRKVTGMKMTRKTVVDDLSMLRRSEPSTDGNAPAITNPEVSLGTGPHPEIPARP